MVRLYLKTCRIDTLFSHVIIGLGCTLLLMQVGCYYSWTSPFLERLKDPNAPIRIDENQESWIVSWLSLGQIFGSIIGPLLAQYLGTRQAVYSSFVPVILSWIFIIWPISISLIYISRLLGGIAVGMAYTTLPTFLGEVTDPKFRGVIINVGFVGLTISSIISSYLGVVQSFPAFSISFLIPAVIGFIIFLCVPDSPHQLIKNGDVDSAVKSLTWYRDGKSVSREFEEINRYINSGESTSFVGNLKEFRAPHVRKAFILVTMLFSLDQISGSNILTTFTETILKDANFNLIKPSSAVVITCIFSMAFGIISVFLIDRYGRRVLMVASSLGLTVTFVIFGTHFLLIDYMAVNPNQLQLIPLFGMILFEASYSIGYLGVPSAVMSEILPSSVKNSTACMASIICGLVGFGLLFVYYPMINWLGRSCVFYFYSLMAFLTTPFVLIFLPETKGKSLYEIQQILIKNS